MKRGDILIVDFSVYNPQEKVRPALAVQNDRDNARMKNTIVALITGNVSRSGEPTQFLLERKHPDYAASGLHKDPVVNFSNLITIRQQGYPAYHRQALARHHGSDRGLPQGRARPSLIARFFAGSM
ncbi:MAG: type II toxin-antitoxin system PemK/MazF family toxin [Thermoguttaceae bacterium]